MDDVESPATPTTAGYRSTKDSKGNKTLFSQIYRVLILSQKERDFKVLLEWCILRSLPIVMEQYFTTLSGQPMLLTIMT